MSATLNNISLNTKILKIAVPSIIGFLGTILFECIDIFWIGKIDGKAVAAVGASAFIQWTIYALMAMSCTGCATLVSQFLGAGKREERYRVIYEAFWLSILISIILMVFLYFFSSDIFNFMGLDLKTHGFAQRYFNIFIYCLPIIYIFSLQGQIFNAYGDTKISSIIMIFCLIINIILDPILIFGLWGFPKLGIAGASIATIISELIGVFIRAYFLIKRKYIQDLSFLFDFTRPFIYLANILRIGIPTAATNAVWTIVFPLLAIIITKFGMDPLAGLNIGNRIEGIPYFFSLGFSIAIATLVGQSYGRGDKEEIKRIVKRGTLIITMILLPVSFIFIFFPEELIGILNSDPGIIKHGADYLKIIGYFELFLGWELIIEGGFNGLGNTRPYMLLRVPLTFLRIPLAYFLAFNLNLGIHGVWWAISVTTLLKGVGLAFIFITDKTNMRLLATDR